MNVLKSQPAACFMLLLFLLSCQSSNLINQQNDSRQSSYQWNLPPEFPLPVIPSDNPMTTAKVDLGRHLFYDKRLSIDQSMSCASCHDQKRAFSDGKTVPTGVTGEAHPRNSMALFNMAYTNTLTWSNHHLDKLETQMLLPMFGETPPELGMNGKEEVLIKRLAETPLYQEKFKQAFPNDQKPFQLLNVTRAIASFERTLISANSPYDRYVYKDQVNAISDSAKRGESLFFSEKLECFHCHGGFNFSDSSSHAKTTFLEKPFHNTGLYNIDGKGDYPANNTGLYELSHQAKDMGRFRAPSLRNIALSAPYMHDGSIQTLDEVIDHYAAGGRTIKTGPYAGDGAKNPYKSAFIKGFQLSAQEKSDLIAFLESLTDTEFTNNPQFSSPFNNPPR